MKCALMSFLGILLFFSCGETGAGGGGSQETSVESTWDDIVEKRIAASDPSQLDYFGRSVSISGDRAVIGARDGDGNVNDSGAAYIFSRNGTSWSQISKLYAGDGAEDDSYGGAVSICDDWVIVGAQGEDDMGEDSGSVYIYGGLLPQKITPGDGASDDAFGSSVSLSGNRAIIGAPGDDDKGAGSGSVYIFEYNPTNGNWSQTAKLHSGDEAAGDGFGCSVAIDGDIALIGSWYDDDSGSASGASYIFSYNTDTGLWSQVAKLTASDAEQYDRFGVSVGISGLTAIVGSDSDDDKGDSSGSAYIFTYDSASEEWLEKEKLTALDGSGGDHFGYSVAIDGSTAVIGMYALNGSYGSAYIFTGNSGTGEWSQIRKLPGHWTSGGFCINSVALSGDSVIVGSYTDSWNGAAYIYTK